MNGNIEPNIIINENNLDALNKQQLIQMVLNLIQEVFQRVTNLRFYHLERNLSMTHQYSRYDTLEISGTPMHIDDDKQLEEEEK